MNMFFRDSYMLVNNIVWNNFRCLCQRFSSKHEEWQDENTRHPIDDVEQWIVSAYEGRQRHAAALRRDERRQTFVQGTCQWQNTTSLVHQQSEAHGLVVVAEWRRPKDRDPTDNRDHDHFLFHVLCHDRVHVADIGKGRCPK